MSAYSEKLKDPRWQRRRLKVMEYAHWRCQICGAKDNTLHCHHSYYTRGKQPWQYPDGSIICICEACHEKIHPEKVKREAPAPEEKPWTFAQVCAARKHDAEQAAKPEDAAPKAEAKSRFAAMRALLEDTGNGR